MCTSFAALFQRGCRFEWPDYVGRFVAAVVVVDGYVVVVDVLCGCRVLVNVVQLGTKIAAVIRWGRPIGWSDRRGRCSWVVMIAVDSANWGSN